MRNLRTGLIFLINSLMITSILIAGCSTEQSTTVVNAPDETEAVTVATSPEAGNYQKTTTPDTLSSTTIFFPPYAPSAFRDNLNLPAGWQEADSPDSSSFQIGIGSKNSIDSVSRWVYAAAVPFPTVDDRVSSADLKSVWSGRIPDGFFASQILAAPHTIDIFSRFWGQPDMAKVRAIPEKYLLARTWNDRTVIALIPFENIEPKWKILEVDGQNPLQKTFDIDKYALTVHFVLQTNKNTATHPGIELVKAFPATNRDPAKLTTVILTGVTALVRGTADLMERYGMDYPAGDIGPILREADITHISNEIPFTPRCPPPFLREDNLVFCSKPEYIQLLEAVGADVIELSGDHFKDWGPDAVDGTIQMYVDRGWKYYGGGFNLEDGRKALQMEVNGNKIAFIGCNAKGKGYSSASETTPGAVHCDFDWLKKEIGRVKAEGYLPIITFQHLEFDSIYPNAQLQTDFQMVSFDGADIISGSQAHQPKTMEFFRDSFLHFGLGNLFFDQYKESLAKRQAFIDRHVIYDNRYINTELITIQFINLARPRLMTDEERRALLEQVFGASGWN